jgi:hypothetical protein
MAPFVLPTGSGLETLLDEDVFEWAKERHWTIFFSGRNKAPYAGYRIKKKGKAKLYLLHRLIVGAEHGQIVDHANRDTLDNRRENLRICTVSQNMANKKLSVLNKCGFKGVKHKETTDGTRISLNAGRCRHIGSFLTPEEAHAAYLAEARRLFGEFAREG